MSQRGDTIVEVLFAVTVFSLVAVGGLSLMNQGSAMAQRSLEIGLVRDQMDAQADALRYIHNAHIANLNQAGATTATVWNEVTSKHVVPEAQSFGDMVADGACKLPESNATIPGSDGTPFAIDIRKLDGQTGSPAVTLSQANNIDGMPTFSQVRYYMDDNYRVPINPAKPEGIWIQPVHQEGSGTALGYYDFHIRACWLTPGQATPVTLGTIVRLYDPAP